MSRCSQPAIAWHAPYGTDERQRQQDQLHHRDVDVLAAPGRVDFRYPSLVRRIDTRIGHHELLRLLAPPHIVLHEDLNGVSPQSLIDIQTKVMEPNLPILPDGPRELAEA